MNTNLLIFFAIPLAVIIFSIVLQRLIKCPILVAGVIFSILLIVVLVLFDPIFLLAVIAYAILAFITAFITSLVCRFINRDRNGCDSERRCSCGCRERRNCCCNRNNNDSDENIQLLTINSTCQNGRNGTILNNATNNTCNCNQDNNLVTANANIILDNSTDGRTGRFTGCYRRR